MASLPRLTERGIRRLLFALLLLWPLVMVDAQGEPMSDPVLLTAKRVVDHHTWTLSDEDAHHSALRAAFDISVYQGRVYSGVAPGATLLAVPVYALLRPVFARFDPDVIRGRAVNYYARNSLRMGLAPPAHLKDVYLLQIGMAWLVMAPLFATLGVRLFAAIRAWGSAPRQALFSSLAVCLGTYVLYYSTMYSRQGLASLLVWHAALTLFGSAPPRAGRVLVASSLAALACVIEYSAAVVVVLSLVCLLPLLGARERIVAVLPIGLAFLGLALYHRAVFGSPFTTPYHLRYFLGGKPLSGPNPATFAQSGNAGMSLPSAGIALALLFGKYKGLFVYFPVLLLAFAGHVRGLHRRRSVWIHGYCLLVFAAQLALNSSMGAGLPEADARAVWGGIGTLWGPRHLLVTVPFLALGLVRLPWKRRWLRSLFRACLAFSTAVALLGCITRGDMTAARADTADLTSPIGFALSVLNDFGVRVPLLDAYFVSTTWQRALFLLLAASSVAAVVIILGSLRAPSENGGRNSTRSSPEDAGAQPGPHLGASG